MKVIKNFNIAIIMYHYIRPIKFSRTPNLNGLEFNIFKKQINFLTTKYNVLDYNNFLDILITK